jgi:hypothetical protein
MHLVEDGAAPALVFSGIGPGEPVPVPPPPAALLEATAARIVDLLGAGAEIEQASPSELRVVAHLPVDLRAATALAHRLGRHLRLPFCMAVADEHEEVRRLAGRLAPEQLLFVLPALAAGERAEPASAPQPQRAPALALAPVPVTPAVATRRAQRLVPASEGPVQLSLFGGAEAA